MRVLKRHEVRFNGSLELPDLPTTPATGVSSIYYFLPSRCIQLLEVAYEDPIQQVRDDMSEMK